MSTLRSDPSPAATRQLLQDGIALHQVGRHEEARGAFEHVLQLDPRQPDALHLLGVLALLDGDPQRAADLIASALELLPRAHQFHGNRASALAQLSRWQEALDHVDQAIGLNPGYALAYVTRAKVLLSLGRLAQALAASERALGISPELPAALLQHAMVLEEADRLPESLAVLDRALRVQPDFADVHFNRGNVLRKMGELSAALAAFEQALALRPDHAEALINLVQVRAQAGQPESAPALDAVPVQGGDVANALLRQADRMLKLNEPAHALTVYEQLLPVLSHDAELHNNRAAALFELGRFQEAVGAFDSALKLVGSDGSVPQGDGMASPLLDLADLHHNRGRALAAHGVCSEALQSFDEAVRLRPSYVAARWNKAHVLLSVGQYTPAWPLYELRWNDSEWWGQGRRPIPQDPWLGGDLSGRTLLLWAEQGLGDSLMAARYAPLAARTGARVVLMVPRTLVGLLSGLPGLAACVEASDTPPAFDAHCPLMSLPLAFGTELHSIPSTSGYLHADPQRVRRWQERLGPRVKPRIGLQWSGKQDGMIRGRSIPLALWQPWLREDVEWISLQKEVPASDRATLAACPQLRHFGPEQTDMGDAAALCALMDRVITVDTSMAHLAGALACATWVLLPAVCDWRWMRERSDSPWYDSVRLWRQSTPGDWSGVLKDVAHALSLQS